MENKYNISNSNIGAVGDNATSIGNVFTQNNVASPIDHVNFAILADEIHQLKLAFARNIQSSQDYEILKEIEVAEEAAKVKDGNTVLDKFKSIGKGTLNLAKEIGVELVASLISKQIGI